MIHAGGTDARDVGARKSFPPTEQQLTLQIEKAKQVTRKRRVARQILKGLGRFAPPALYARSTPPRRTGGAVKLMALLNAQPGAN